MKKAAEEAKEAKADGGVARVEGIGSPGPGRTEKAEGTGVTNVGYHGKAFRIVAVSFFLVCG